MRRVLETVFRHPIQLIVLMLAPTLIGSTIALAQPRVYEASATLWANQRYATIGATGIEADLSATAASTQATAITELLQTRSFALAVANQTDLKSTLDAATRNNADSLNDALFSEISKNVKVTPIGANLYQITYDNQHPAVAKQVVTAVVQSFGVVTMNFSTAEAQQLLASYTDQLNKAQATAAASAQKASDYINLHPNANTARDPLYLQLYNQSQADQAVVLSLQSKIAQLNQQIASIGTTSQLYRIIDEPSVNDRPVSRVKTVGLGAGIGLAVALLGCTIYLVMLLRQDRTVYGPAELRRATPLPVVLELPYLSGAKQSQAATARIQARN